MRAIDIMTAAEKEEWRDRWLLLKIFDESISKSLVLLNRKIEV